VAYFLDRIAIRPRLLNVGGRNLATPVSVEAPPAFARCGKGAVMQHILKFLCDEQAATAVEYAVMLALILMVIIGSIVTVGQGTGGMWSGNLSAMQSAGFGS